MNLLLYLRDLPRAAGNLNIIEILQIEPKFRVRVEVTRQPQSLVGRNAASSAHNFPFPLILLKIQLPSAIQVIYG